MSWKWKRTVRQYPELLLFDTEAARKDEFQLANSNTVGGVHFWSWVVVCSGFMGVFGGAGLPGWLPPQMHTRIAKALIDGAIIYIFAASFYEFIFRKGIHRHLRQRLLESGVAICLKCGYQLRGLNSPQCPECGEAFDPGLLCEQNERVNASSE